jgi:hypothetical protein
MTIAEQIAALEETRKEKAARMTEVAQKSMGEARSMEDAEAQEFDTLEGEIKRLDEDVARLRKLLAVQAASAQPAQPSPAAGQPVAPGYPSIKTAPKPEKLEPGVGFARVAKIKALARLDNESPRYLAKEIYGEKSLIHRVFTKEAVPAGTTTDSTWAGPLVGDETSIFADFVEFLRPMTILGRFGANGVPALRRVPFRVALIGQTSGGAGYWVGEGKAKPLTKFDFERKTLDPLKVANIAVVTEETLRDSSPSAEMILRDQLAAALRERLDTDFIDPDKAASSGLSPASILNAPTGIASIGSDADAVRCDVKAVFEEFIAANNTPTSGVWIMPSTIALALSLMQNALGQPEFPGIGMMGGTFYGLPVIVSEYVPTDSEGAVVALVNASDIYLADDGGISVDMSREASLQMDDSPTNDSDTPTATSLVSLWQTNSVGFRAERTINWMARRTSAAAYLTGVTWGDCASA